MFLLQYNSLGLSLLFSLSASGTQVSVALKMKETCLVGEQLDDNIGPPGDLDFKNTGCLLANAFS